MTEQNQSILICHRCERPIYDYEKDTALVNELGEWFHETCAKEAWKELLSQNPSLSPNIFMADHNQSSVHKLSPRERRIHYIL